MLWSASKLRLALPNKQLQIKNKRRPSETFEAHYIIARSGRANTGYTTNGAPLNMTR